MKRHAVKCDLKPNWECMFDCHEVRDWPFFACKKHSQNKCGRQIACSECATVRVCTRDRAHEGDCRFQNKPERRSWPEDKPELAIGKSTRSAKK
jgi:hypothetical protein